MRKYGTVSPKFWTQGSGKRLRGDKDAQLVALYLMTCTATSMVGIFQLSLATLAHDTGLTLEEASKGLRRCSEEAIAFYDDDSEVFWVPALPRYQVGDALKVGKNGKPDLRSAGCRRALEPFKGHRFYYQFLERYADAYLLADLLERDSEGASNESPLQGAYVPVPVPVPVLDDPEGGAEETTPSSREIPMAADWDPGPKALAGGGIPDWAHPDLLARFRNFHLNREKPDTRTHGGWVTSYGRWATGEWQRVDRRPKKPQSAIDADTAREAAEARERTRQRGEMLAAERRAKYAQQGAGEPEGGIRALIARAEGNHA